MQPNFAAHQQTTQALCGAPSAPPAEGLPTVATGTLLARAPDRLAKGSEGKLFVTSGQRNLSEASISYKRVQIPSVMEVERWVQALAAVPEEGSADVALPVDYTLRFEMLAYLRNDGEEAQSLVLKSQASDLEELVELQFHGTSEYEKGAHAVAYIYKLPSGGVGVVVCFKGTTCNASDWGADMKYWRAKDSDVTRLTTGTPLFPAEASGSGKDARIHPGYAEYYHTILARMQQFSMDHLQPLLQQWECSSSRIPVVQGSGQSVDFLTWLRAGAWKWCVCVGHSLGGALASYAATDFAVHCGKATLLSTSGTPGCGNEEFMRLQNEVLAPAGGLRIHNHGDVVTMTGYTGIALRASRKSHAGRSVVLWPRVIDRLDPYHNHLRFRIPSDIFGEPLMVTYKFPGWTYRASAEHSDASALSTHFLGVQWTSSKDFPLKTSRRAGAHRSSAASAKKTLPPLWLQWYDDEHGVWKGYCDRDQRLLRKAFAEEKPGVHLMIDGREAYCDLQDMVQRSLGADSEFHETEMKIVFEDDEA